MNDLKSKTENKLKIRGELSADVAFDANNLNSLKPSGVPKEKQLDRNDYSPGYEHPLCWVDAAGLSSKSIRGR
jgi:hypothetical protein